VSIDPLDYFTSIVIRAECIRELLQKFAVGHRMGAFENKFGYKTDEMT